MTGAEEMIPAYARAGIGVFPLHGIADGRCTCGRDCPSPGKHPRLGLAHRKDDPARYTCRGECGRLGHGLHDATTDAGQVVEWLAAFPTANWAVRPPKGVLVLDIDPRNGGDVELAKLEEEHGKLPATLTARTGSGGFHIWLSYDGPTRGKLCTGVDVKTNTGYLVSPPSVHIAGGTYTWIDERPAAYAPKWVKERMNPPRIIRSMGPVTGTRGERTRAGLVEFVQKSNFGEINDRLYWAACRLDEKGLLDTATADQLVAAAGEAAGPQATGAGEMQSRRTIESARRRPADATRRKVAL